MIKILLTKKWTISKGESNTFSFPDTVKETDTVIVVMVATKDITE